MIQPPVVSADRPHERISFENFLVQYEGVAAEWVDGEVEFVSVKIRHAQANSVLVGLVTPFAWRHDLGTGAVRSVGDEDWP